MIKLSIIIPVYNNAEQIARCLDSILNTTATFIFEVIVVNDGSTDTTPDILKKYKNITIVNQANAGVSAARNTGISKTRGKYIMFVDADDYLNLNWPAVIAPFLDQNLDYVAFSEKLMEKPSTKDIPQTICGFNAKFNLSPVFSKLFSHNIIRQNHLLFNTAIINGEDMLFNLNFTLYCKKYHFETKNFYNYSKNIQSATHTFSPKLLQSDFEFQKQLTKVLKKYGNEYTYLSTLSTINAWATIFDHYSYSTRFQKKDLLPLLDNPYYQKQLQCYNQYRVYFPRQKLILFWLLSHHLYKTTFYFIKFKHLLKQFRKQEERI